MIINIRGTSGSGKSTLVRKIMALYPNKTRVMDTSIPEGKTKPRKQPVGYILDGREGYPPLAVVGHYETDCGGCDTISKMEDIFDRVRTAHHAGMDVLFEGLLISADVNRTQALHAEGLPLNVIALNLPLEVCLESVNGRRKAKADREGKDYKGDVNPDNTASKHKGVQQSVTRLQTAGVPTWSYDNRDAAYNRIMELLA